MLTELDADRFDLARDLCAPLAFRLDAMSVVEDRERGRIWVDDPDRPRAAFLVSTMACFVAGESHAAFRRDLARLITEELYVTDPLGTGRRAVRIVTPSVAWDEAMADVFAPVTPIPTQRRYYTLDLAEDLKDCSLPEGYTTCPVDLPMISAGEIQLGPPVIRPMEWGGRSVETYLARRFVCIVVHDGKAVASCHVNNIQGSVCEVGVGVHEDHRRKGLAVAAVLATLMVAKERGLARAEWNCDPRNVGSVRVADRVGFTLEREYMVWFGIGDEKIHAEQWERWRQGKLV